MNNHVKTRIALCLSIFILISTGSYNIHYKQPSISTDSPQTSSTNNFSEDFESTTFMDESETTVQGWGLNNITLPNKNITLSRIDENPNWKDLFILGDIAYLGGYKVLYCYDISDPTSPTLLFHNFSTNFYIMSIYVDGGYIFAALYNGGLAVFDVSDPTDFRFVTALWDYDVDGGSQEYKPRPFHVWAIPSGSGTSWHVYLWDDYHGLVSLLFTEPELIVQIGGYDPGPNNYILDAENGNLFIQDDLAYVTYGELLIINISDRANPIPINTYHPGTGGDIKRFFLLDDMVYYEYFYSFQSSHFKILNVSDPYSPSPVYTASGLDHWISSISVSNGLAYLGYSVRIYTDTWAGYFSVYNVSDPSNANLIYTYASPYDHVRTFIWRGVSQIVAQGNYGYMFDRQFFIIDISLIDQYESEATAQSKVVYSGITDSINCAFLSANLDLPMATDVLYSLSADNGTHWEQVDLDTWHNFSNIGSKLRWKAILSTSDPYFSPSVFSINITYRTILHPVTLTMPFNQSIIYDRTPHFEWSTITGAVAYILQIDNSSSFSSPNLLNFKTPYNYYMLTNKLQQGIWYWRVVAIDSGGDKGMFTPHFSFTMDLPPGLPSLLSPQPNDYINDATPYLSWNNAFDACNFTIELDTVEIFSSLDLIEIGGVISTEYIIYTPLNETKWYWRVCAFDVSNNQGDFSEIYYFTIDITNPTINNPANLVIDKGASGIQIQWNPNDSNPLSYFITKNGEELYNQPWDGSSVVLDVDSSEHGIDLYTCTIYDKSGNSVSDSVIVVTRQANFPSPDLFPLVIGLSIGGVATVIVIGLIVKKRRRSP